MSKNADIKPVAELTYEQAFAELEGILSALETEQRPLEETMALFERGQALVKRCAELLDKAEIKVRQLSGEELTSFVESQP
ncbi:MAG: exodeoxyribonuclease VII small subunit [Chloroflexi bacterium]|nr:exodeoxyribonuclease VII small subunit [Chloroflexota bacterium]